MFTERIHRYIFVFSLILLAVSMPFSVFLMSVSQFLLATNWILELDFKAKWKRLIDNKPAQFLIGLFLLHLLWMLNSSNMAYGWHDIRIKVPLFVLALLVGTTKPLTFSEFKLVLNFFIAAIVSSSVFSSLIYFGIIEREITDVRQISIFISHIRLSLLVNMGIFSAFYLLLKASVSWLKALYMLTILGLLFFLFILNAYTGLIVFVVMFFVLIIRAVLRYRFKGIKYLLLVVSIVMFISGLVLMNSYYERFTRVDDYIEIKQLDQFTVNGNKYKHARNQQVENGHYIYLYNCEAELEREWNKISEIPYQVGLTKKKSRISFTIINYMTSLGLRKDSLGFSKLKAEDIKMIEDGYANYLYKNKYSLYTKLYPIFRQLYLYNIKGYAEGASVAQRFEYLKIAQKIIKEHFWFGTGTGDVDDAFREHYIKGESKLSEEYQHRAHNQFITFFISFGLFGFLLATFFMIAPLYKDRKYFLPLAFMLTAILSMLNEDTLETQAGITFFTYFYVLFFIAFSFDAYTKDKKHRIV